MIEQSTELIEQANTKMLDMLVWKRALAIRDLNKVVNPSLRESTHSVYLDLMQLDKNQEAAEKVVRAKSKVFLNQAKRKA